MEKTVPRRARKWFLVRPESEAISRILADGGVSSPILATLLATRGLADPAAIKAFLEPNLKDLHSPFQLPGIEAACVAIEQAVSNKERIGIHGDYDVDGLTGTSVLVLALRQMGARPDFHIPHRRREGYGLTPASIDHHHREGRNLVITVDCGITALEACARARELGLRLVITDHHEPRSSLPEAEALVHPALPGSVYPFAGISGAMVAFKLAWALAIRACGSEKVSQPWQRILLQGLGLAALGAVADHVPLVNENRALVRCGLAYLDQHATPGIRALMDVSFQGRERPLRSEDVAFQLAPRLNAAGRLECARFCVDLFTEPDAGKARRIAEMLDGYNRTRKKMEADQSRQAKEDAREKGGDSPVALVLGRQGWQPGLVGIVASRLVEEFHCPAFTVAIPPWDEESADEPLAVGSARSAGGLPVHEALASCGDLLASHGGHRAAAGFKLHPDNLPALSDRIQEFARAHFRGAVPRAALCLDAEVSIDSLTIEQVRQIDRLEPFGMTNRSRVFLATGLRLSGEPRVVGTQGTTLQFSVTQGGRSIGCVGFQLAERIEELKSGDGRVSLAFQAKVETFNGATKVKMHVLDFQAGVKPEIEVVSAAEAAQIA